MLQSWWVSVVTYRCKLFLFWHMSVLLFQSFYMAPYTPSIVYLSYRVLHTASKWLPLSFVRQMFLELASLRTSRLTDLVSCSASTGFYLQFLKANFGAVHSTGPRPLPPYTWHIFTWFKRITIEMRSLKQTFRIILLQSKTQHHGRLNKDVNWKNLTLTWSILGIRRFRNSILKPLLLLVEESPFVTRPSYWRHHLLWQMNLK